MTLETATAQSTRAQIVRELYELIAALDRRVPQVERVGETSIARAAAALKSEALKRIEDLEREIRPGSSRLR
jgi:Trp operon repressor